MGNNYFPFYINLLNYFPKYIIIILMKEKSDFMSEKNIEVKELDLNDILPNRFQPRIKFNEDLILDLSESIKEHGVIQPIIVRPIDDKYEIVAGERRFKASVLAGLTTIPSIVLNLEDKDSIEYALLENVQREDLSAIEEAITYKKILDMGYITQVQLAQKLGKSQSAIANKLRLLKLCDEVQEALMERKISERHARSLLTLESHKEQKDLLYKVIKEKLTVRQLDKEISELSNSDDENENEDLKDSSNESISSNETNEKNEVIDDDKDEISNSEINDNKEIDSLNNTVNQEELEIEDEKLNNSMIENTDSKEITSEDNELADNEIESKEDTTDEVDPTIDEENDDEKEFVNIDAKEEVNNSMFNTELEDDKIQSGKFFSANLVSEEDNQKNLDSSNSTSDISSDNSTSSNIFTAKMSELLSPQNSSNVVNNNEEIKNSENVTDSKLTNASNVFGVQEESSSNNSIFSNLLDREDNESNANNYYDKQSLDKYLDPTYVDGKQNIADNPDIQVDNPIFTKLAEENNLQTVEINEPPKQDNNIGSFQEFNSSVKKPDLLAPMENSISMNPNPANTEINNTFNNIANEKVELESSVNNQLTPDVTLDYEEKEKETLVNNYQDETNEESSDIQPIFVNSSFDNNELSAPKTPIITNTEMSNLLSKPIAEDSKPIIEESIPKESIDDAPSTIAESANIPTTNNNFMTSEDVQPIIITDYNKQYDPILPVSNTIATPTIDFKHILNLIRNLNNEIEGYGYKIDTEEIDLEDKYQVIFNIDKK